MAFHKEMPPCPHQRAHRILQLNRSHRACYQQQHQGRLQRVRVPTVLHHLRRRNPPSLHLQQFVNFAIENSDEGRGLTASLTICTLRRRPVGLLDALQSESDATCRAVHCASKKYVGKKATLALYRSRSMQRDLREHILATKAVATISELRYLRTYQQQKRDVLQ